MTTRRTIFFDVGNTLLYPNRPRILAPLAVEHHPTLEQWQAIEREIKLEYDNALTAGNVDFGFWQSFQTRLLAEQNVADSNGLSENLRANSQKAVNWDVILPGTREALDRIRQNFRIAVISNSDGQIESVLQRTGIADCFETIVDSGIVGYEKPHREIFEAALKTMKAQPEASLYVGDIYSVDYLGARNAGMDAVLFDVAGTYRDRNLPRVESLTELEKWLEQ
jgi:HAD superfamily hydrolase (TIGR01549 family)